MSNPNKHWSWRAKLSAAVGSAAGSAAGGAFVGALGGPVGPAIGAAIGAGSGFISSLVGSAVGHWLDDPYELEPAPGSEALHALVVTTVLSALFGLLALNQLVAHPEFATSGIVAISAMAGFLSSMSRALIEDSRARVERP